MFILERLMTVIIVFKSGLGQRAELQKLMFGKGKILSSFRLWLFGVFEPCWCQWEVLGLP